MEDLQKATRRLTILLVKLSDTPSAFSENDYTESEGILMYALDDGVPHSQREIADTWQIPRTTLNTIVKQWERKGFLTLTAIPGKRREMEISLTETGTKYVKERLKVVYQAEQTAMEKTFAKYGESFIDALAYFSETLEEAYHDITPEQEESI